MRIGSIDVEHRAAADDAERQPCDGCARAVCVCDRQLDEDGPIDDDESEAAASGTAFMRP